MANERGLSRRDFVKTGTATAALATLAWPAFGEEPEAQPLRIGLVGCGGRGRGAAEDCLNSSENLELVALADIFPEPLAAARAYLSGRNLPGYAVTEDRCYLGFDAYRHLLDSDVDVVLFATPPGFRPMHFEAAIDAGKHVFFEKPVAVDPVGVRKVIAAGEKARQKGLAVVAGTQYRHHRKFIETIDQVHAGRIGDIVSGRAYYNVGQLWHRGSKPEWSDMEYQIRNWYYFCWLSGDHIVEQHVHTIDVTNWMMGANPVRAIGLGGRQARTEKKFGNIYDHFAIDYEYPDGRHVTSMCRQMNRSANHVGAYFEGTRGLASPYRGKIEGEDAWSFEGRAPNPYVQEHADLIASIRAGAPLNEARQVAESTLTAIMGREAAYTGGVVEWDALMNSDLDLSAPRYEWGPARMRPVPIPGRDRIA